MALEANVLKVFPWPKTPLPHARSWPDQRRVIQALRSMRRLYQVDAVYMVFSQGDWHLFGRLKKSMYLPHGAMPGAPDPRDSPFEFQGFVQDWVGVARGAGTAFYVPVRGEPKKMDPASVEWALHNIAAQHKMIWRGRI